MKDGIIQTIATSCFKTRQQTFPSARSTMKSDKTIQWEDETVPADQAGHLERISPVLHGQAEHRRYRRPGRRFRSTSSERANFGPAAGGPRCMR